MNIPLSTRLRHCAQLVHPGDRVADVGCDHGYLGIYLLQQGIADSIIAADIREQPLASAVKNAEKFGYREKMAFYLSDGVKSIPRDFDCLVCAGMGGDTMISIVESAPWLKTGRYRLILQCQSKTHELRRYLSDTGWQICQEDILRDGRFLYTVMEVIYAPGQQMLSAGQCYFTPAILKNPGAEAEEYYGRMTDKLRLAVNARGEGADATQREALAELEAMALQPDWPFHKEERT